MNFDEAIKKMEAGQLVEAPSWKERIAWMKRDKTIKLVIVWHEEANPNRDPHTTYLKKEVQS